MFPNIDNNLGLTEVKNALNARERKMPSTNCILEEVKICLECNHSVFKDKFSCRSMVLPWGLRMHAATQILQWGNSIAKQNFAVP